MCAGNVEHSRRIRETASRESRSLRNRRCERLSIRPHSIRSQLDVLTLSDFVFCEIASRREDFFRTSRTFLSVPVSHLPTYMITHSVQISSAQRDKVLAYIESGVQEGATLATGGKKWTESTGFYVTPTVLSNCKHEFKCVQEEVSRPLRLFSSTTWRSLKADVGCNDELRSSDRFWR
jgi:hypothetical protein